MMKRISGFLKLLLLAVAVFVIAFELERRFVPGIRPVIWSQDPQPLWQVETAFLLRSLQNVAALAAVVIVVIGAGTWLRKLLRTRA